MALQPKSYKKFVASAATATLVATALIPAASAAETKSFSDVSSTYKVAVDYLVANDIANGTSDTTFGTTATITRGDAAVMIAKALKLDTAKAPDAGFKDVNARVAGAVNALVEAKIVSGKTATTFAPDANITRQEMAKIVTNAYKLDAGTTTNQFTDVNSNWDGFVDALVANGITLGKTESTFASTASVTRGEFALFVYRSETLTPATPEVVSVSAINATQVEVKFNQAVTTASVFADGTGNNPAFKAGVVTFTAKDGQAATTYTGKLSADGKTLTVTHSAAVSKRYDVVIEGVVSVKDAKTVVKYDKLVNFAADVTAPTILSTEKISASSYKVKFSEPMNIFGNVTFKYADGTAVVVSGGIVATGDTEAVFNIDANEPVNGKAIVATFIGAQDRAGNLLTPNPATVSFVKGAADGVAPVVSTITQTGATKFAVKFTEALLANPTITASGYTTTVAKDATDPTVYNVTTNIALDGLSTVAVSNFSDLSGQAGTTTTKLIAFVKETAVPKVVSSTVVVDETTRKEMLEVTFDKNVVLTNATVDGTGSMVKDFITTSVGAADLAATSIVLKSGTKNVVRVELDTFLGAGAFDVKGSTYSLDLVFAGVVSETGVVASGAKSSFTRGEDGVPASAAVAEVTTALPHATDNNKVNVTFNTPVDGATATNPANYKVDGAIVESVTLLPAGATQVAVLNLKANSNGFTGIRNINITNVKALGSTKVMKPYGSTITLNENIVPTITTAVLTSTTTLEVTFSENVINASSAVGDFVLYVDGVASATTVSTEAQPTATDNKLVLTLGTAVTAADLAKALTLKAATTIDVADNAGNLVSVPNAITISK